MRDWLMKSVSGRQSNRRPFASLDMSFCFGWVSWNIGKLDVDPLDRPKISTQNVAFLFIFQHH